MFDPSAGRWLTQDPMGFEAGDANLYRYVGNGPTNAVDPEGTDIPGDPSVGQVMPRPKPKPPDLVIPAPPPAPALPAPAGPIIIGPVRPAVVMVGGVPVRPGAGPAIPAKPRPAKPLPKRIWDLITGGGWNE